MSPLQSVRTGDFTPLLLETAKTEIFLRMVRQYPELTSSEIERMVERDWGHMNEAEREEWCAQVVSEVVVEECDRVEKELAEMMKEAPQPNAKNE